VPEFQEDRRANIYGTDTGHGLEATDADGHLFGFKCVPELLRVALRAAAVANAEQSFGQDDHISVISATRTAALETAAA
jgi:hypothetical protein